MIVGESTVTINRPVEDVFGYVSEPKNEPTWHNDVVEVRTTSEGPVELGARLGWTVRFAGLEDYTIEVTELEPNRLLRITTREGRGHPTLTHRFEPVDDGTRYTRRVEIQPEGLFRVLQPVMRLQAPRRNARWAQNLKQVLEANVHAQGQQ
jgi:uncharacterized protein YndB with AHSA1/START domain